MVNMKRTIPAMSITDDGQLNSLRLIRIGRIIATNATINPRFTITDPTALPTANPGLPSILDMTETVNSGVVVARLTMVPPTTILGKPVRRAISTLAPTKKSPPLIMSPRPIRNRNTVNHIS
jgi:hypothetical protein